MLLENSSAFRSADDLTERHGRVFGEWLRGEGGFPSESLANTVLNIPAEFSTAWRAAVAEEWFVARCCCAVGEDIPEFLRKTQLFPNGPTLTDLALVQAATAVIPLDRQPFGATARVWVADDPDNKLAAFANAELAGIDDLFPRGSRYRIFFAGYDSAKVDGSSWQLGAMLARHALDQNDREAFRKLASEWIITGRVSIGPQPSQLRQVEWVGLGTKARLPQHKRDGGRSWLLPAANERPGEETYQELASFAAGRLHFARSLADAWNHLTGEGAILAPDQPWPTDCEEVHGFVSDSQGPFLALILRTMPKRVVLWVSDTMSTQAEELSEALFRICADRNLETPKLMREYLPDASNPIDGPESHHSADLLAVTERGLAMHRTLSKRHGGRILFNNTGGNFLHRTAAVRRASLNPRLWLAYRDINNARTPHFTLLRHHVGQLLTGRLLVVPETQKTKPPIDWQRLVDHRRLSPLQRDGPKPTSEEQIEALVAAASPKS